LALLIAAAWYGGRPLWRIIETNFWSLNALAVQPIYAISREALRQLAERFLPAHVEPRVRDRTRAICAAISGMLICGFSLWIATLAWPNTRWTGSLSDLTAPTHLAHAALFNSVVIVVLYLAMAGLAWAVADTLMPQPRDIAHLPAAPAKGKVWRVAHLSDIHVVGERFGFRIEGGRSGPRGNQRLQQAFAALDAAHARNPLDVILITGDMTDAGRSSEWAEFIEALAPYPGLADILVLLPGNHDLNVVDRANPARFDLPTSPKRRLREMRALSAICGLQGKRVHVADAETGKPKATLEEALQTHIDQVRDFADKGTTRLAWKLAKIWPDAFPMVLLPKTPDDLGVILLDSNAQTHFSFTNALGLVSWEQTSILEKMVTRFPEAKWIVALHHHAVEYPKPAKALSERIGTALVNGTWFVRRMQRLADRVIIMHGHRHIDWIGRCGDLTVVSAPSPVMDVTDDKATYFYIHHLGAGPDGRFGLFAPERIVLHGDPAS
jgi:predicted MPP superfamily phosphohydrolase